MRIIRIRKGLNVPLLGAAEKQILKPGLPTLTAIKPTDFLGFRPRLLVKEGDIVKAGNAIILNKADERIFIPSPLSGTVAEVVRGEKRLLREIRIKPDQEQVYESFGSLPPTADRENIRDFLLKSGCWAFIRQRPYDIIPNPDVIPRDIYISTFDTAPLAPDYSFTLKEDIPSIQKAIDILGRLTDGKVHLGIQSMKNESSIFDTLDHVEKHYFSGPHPAGNVGVHIHHTQPINKGDVIWTINIADLRILATLFEKGIVDTRRTLAITGPDVERPIYIETYLGASISDLYKLKESEYGSRIISGNVLNGETMEPDGFNSFYDHQLTIIPEGKYFEFAGWAMPGFKKFSKSKLFISKLLPPRKYKIDTNLHGGVRAFVLTGQYEKVFPFDIYPVYLLKAVMTGDIDKMEQLGIYEVSPEDFALCDFVCTSKIEAQETIAQGLELLRKEMS